MGAPERNYVLGAGKVFVALEDEDGNLGGERYIGNSPGLTLTVETENLELWDADDAVAQKLEDVVTQVTRSGVLTVNDVGLDNVALFVMGDRGTVQQSGTPVTDYPVNDAQPGHYYQLGATDQNPTGHRNVSAVTVELASGGGPIPAEDGENYEVDLALGRLYIPEGSAITAGANLHVDYTPAAGIRDQIVTSGLGTKFGALRYIANNTKGRNRDLYAPRVKFAPNAEMALKSRDTWQELQFALEYLTRGALAAVYIDGRPVSGNGSA